ncbi:hypothetical protein [Pedobacter chitinilyticus]|uniref:Uncharacterized protein n=1 Tax=Pedobacter chitinilyticus TaxID=2233776 RepID=A0A443YZZ7_9SPHI|nr:hypothetical protein [Pedobacter chitinilyticus]RWU09883.1 hypothetical protein DPV69_00615 [Pedobacter chitinilyticus]
MVDLLKELKLDKWYGVTLYIGILCCAAPFFKKIEFLNEKHLFALGLGLLMISLSNFIANRYVQQPIPGGFLQWQEIIHSPFTMILQIVGGVIAFLFLFLLFIDLI